MAEKRFEIVLSDAVLAGFGWQEEGQEQLPYRVLEALVMELLRLDRLSEGEAAHILGLENRWDLFDTMGRYEVPVIRLTPEELKEELKKGID
jgi:hypothetical protein